ncbi:MAG: nicotinate (nicotinamide) nucleotide adenylyltransferase [Anaerolineae bacterium]|nr:nicotinate (nicotinamide) nucleotide adenylyltransferase [Anaerolineae bacterium]
MQSLSYGVFGGTFDPPHYGHLALAETARVQLGLARVIFVPAGLPPHKRNGRLSSPEHRAAMVQAAIADNPSFILSRVDIDRPGPHYTVEMLRRLREQFSDVTAWYFLMGEDSLHDLPHWYEPKSVLRQASLAVMHRHGKPVQLDVWRERLPELEGKLVWLDVPPVNFSATILRRRVREGLPLRYLVPTAVAEYIGNHRLYDGL